MAAGNTDILFQPVSADMQQGAETHSRPGDLFLWEIHLIIMHVFFLNNL